MEARKRSTGLLPTTTTSQSGSPSTNQRTSPRSSRRRTSTSSSKRAKLYKYLGGSVLGIVILLYVMATRHVVLHSSSSREDPNRSRSKLSALRSLDDHNPNKRSDNNENYMRVLFHPIQVVSSLNNIHDNSPLLLPKKPRILGYFYGDKDASSFVGIDHNNLPIHDNRHSQKQIERQTLMDGKGMERQRHLANSKDYRSGRADTLQDQGKDCVAQYPWQESFHPTSNHVMELDMTHFASKNDDDKYNNQAKHQKSSDSEEDDDGVNNNNNNNNNNNDSQEQSLAIKPASFEFLANGYWRDVWKVTVDYPPGHKDVIIFKTQRYEHDFEPRNWDRHRRDAVVMDELTYSKHIMDIYGFCGSAGVFEFAGGGDLDSALWPDEDDVVPWTPQERLIVGYQVVQAIAAVHNHPKEGVPAIAHTDVALGQYVYVESVGGFKLQDFNRARFIAWNNKTNEACTYEVGNNPGNFRSPEEYAYEEQSEKVDIYSMGNILYCILTLLYPFEHVKAKEVYKKVMNGTRPEIPPQFLNSTDPYDQTMLKAIEMSWRQDQTKRASAREIQELMLATLKQLNVRADGTTGEKKM